MREMTIAGRRIADDTECYVIAEIGHNHQGDVERAKEMFRVAKECGVDAVKLQKRDNRTLFTRELYEQPYNSENSFGATYGAHREALEFGREHYVELQQTARELGLAFFATAFDVRSADFLAELDMPAYKIASGDILNTPLLKHVASIGRPVIMSTGGAELDSIRRAYDVVAAINPQVCVLQCTASYPCEPEMMNLQVIGTLRKEFPNAVVGLSDHQNGIALSVIAYALGGRVIEKHFTLNRASRGTDHAFSLEPVGMKKMVRDLHRARAAMGDGVKRRLPEEEKPLYKMAKKLVAARPLDAGTTLTANDIAIKSPGDGLPPYMLDRLVGRVIRRPMTADDTIRLEDLAD